MPDHNPDLCEACALGKPTRDLSYAPQVRSSVKGKLWYFDVSVGGEVTPSLKTMNKYIFMFADSCTRMYFDFYTQRIDEPTVLRFLNEFSELILTGRRQRDMLCLSQRLYLGSRLRDTSEIHTISGIVLPLFAHVWELGIRTLLMLSTTLVRKTLAPVKSRIYYSVVFILITHALSHYCTITI